MTGRTADIITKSAQRHQSIHQVLEKLKGPGVQGLISAPGASVSRGFQSIPLTVFVGPGTIFNNHRRGRGSNQHFNLSNDYQWFL